MLYAPSRTNVLPESLPPLEVLYAEGRSLDAAAILDSSGILRRQALERTQQRLVEQTEAKSQQDPLTDVLGSARLVVAARAAGLSTHSLEQNLRHDVRTGLIEAVQAEGHETTTRMSVTADGRTHVGNIMVDDLILRGIHPRWSDILNQYGEIDYYGELMSRAHFNDPYLRSRYNLASISLLPSDQGLGDTELHRYGFRPENKKWVIDELSFEPDVLQWERLTHRLFMSGSDVQVANTILQEQEIVQDGEVLDTVNIRRRFVLVPKARYPLGVAIGLGRRADELMAQQNQQPFFCGKQRTQAPTDADYLRLRADSQRREAEIEEYVDVLARVALHLSEDTTLGFEEQNDQYAAAIIQALQKICTDNPEYAEHAFGLKAAWLYKEAQRKREAGDTRGADQDLHEAIGNSQTATICNLVITAKKGGAESSSHVSPFASLAEKYGAEKIMIGKCICCGTDDVEVGECGRDDSNLDGEGICNVCDTADRLVPGYTAELMKKREQQKRRFKGFWATIFGRQDRRADATGQPARGRGKA